MAEHATKTDGVWRLMRFETDNGKWAEVASNQVGPEAIPVPAGYRFVSSTPMVAAAQLDEARAENERLRDALTSARALVGAVHVIDAWKGYSVHVPAEDDFYWVSDGVHTEDCSACALERTIDAALALGSAEATG